MLIIATVVVVISPFILGFMYDKFRQEVKSRDLYPKRDKGGSEW